MGPELRLQLLGSISITLGEQPITPLRSRTAEALLIYLAMHHKPFSRQVLADLFWDERSQKQALSNLRTILTMLRRELGDHLHIARHTVAFNHESPHWLDATEFTHLLTPTPFQSPISTLQSALHLYHGDFLSGFSLPESRGFEAWSMLVREQLRQMATAALHRLSRHFLDNGQYEIGVPYAQRLLHMNSLDERAQRLLMELFWRDGRRAGAIQQYQSARQLLAKELAVEPDPATTALYERIRDTPFPPPCCVPTPLTAFVDRDEELASLSTFLSDPYTRLITILGPGGIGKTRLLIEAARQTAITRPGRFPDGVYFIPLASLPSADFLPTTLAGHIGLTFQGQTDAAEQVLSYLQPREMLLALDNFEHLITPTSLRWLARIAEEAPAVRLLITSRARLGLYGEHLLELGGLAAPSPTMAEPQDVASVRLFTAHAAAVRPNFAPDAVEMAAIVRLCNLVDGMPLALELAAAGARHLHCREIVAQVQEKLDWEFGHFPNRPRRHQNLQAVFAHSWSMLDVAQQAAARRLSVFAGPFDAAAAQAVAHISAARLAALRDQSLLAEVRAGWFGIHPLIRRFLAEKLDRHPDEARETAHRHARHIVQLVASFAPEKNMESYYRELQSIMVDWHDQVVAAALWLARNRDFSRRSLVSLIERLNFYFSYGDQFETWKVVYAQLVQALAEGEGETENATWLTAVLRSRIAGADIELHAYGRAQAQFEQLLPEAMRIENGALLSYCHHMLGRLAMRRAAFAAAYRHLAAALPPLEPDGYGPQYYFPVYRTWTEAAVLAGDVAQARATADKAYQLALDVDSEAEAAPIYAWALGEIARLEGDLPQAREHLEHALALSQVKGNRQEIARCKSSLAEVLEDAVSLEEAEEVIPRPEPPSSR